MPLYEKYRCCILYVYNNSKTFCPYHYGRSMLQYTIIVIMVPIIVIITQSVIIANLEALIAALKRHSFPYTTILFDIADIKDNYPQRVSDAKIGWRTISH